MIHSYYTPVSQVVVPRCYGQRLGYVESTARKFSEFNHFLNAERLCYSELSAPDELIPYLLQPEIASLSPDITAVCIQSATKLFGYWASEAAKQWTDGFLEDLKKAVDIMIEQMEGFVSSSHIEVQERVSGDHPQVSANLT
jgi:hypothetical protein